MNPPTSRPAIVAGDGDETPASRFRGLVRKSVLLNAVIVLTSFPVLVFAGGPRAVAPSLAIMAGITAMIWAATFILSSCASVGRILWTALSSARGRKPPDRVRRAGVADRWIDGPG
jgi:hypothetical protein